MAEEANGPSRISVSLEALRNEIELANSRLELRLIEKLASKSDVAHLSDDLKDLERRVEVVEKSKAEQDAVASYKKWFVGGGLLTTGLLFAQFFLAVYAQTHGS